MNKLILLSIIYLSTISIGIAQNYPKLIRNNDSTFVLFTITQAQHIYTDGVLLDKYQKMDKKVIEVNTIDEVILVDEVKLSQLSESRNQVHLNENKRLSKELKKAIRKQKIILILSTIVIILVLI